MKSKTPKHIAIIMDGNRRWAKKKGLPVVAGHKKVVDERIEELIDRAGELGIQCITFWAFSTENWSRDKKEVGGIMNLFRMALEKKAERLIKKGARVRVIGDLSKFDDDIREGMEKLMESSKKNEKIKVLFGLNYGGRDEIVRAVRETIKEVLRLSGLSHQSRNAEDDKLSMGSLESLSNKELEKLIEKNLDTAGVPDPDMIIRTSGEQRLSGFMPWQSVYSEFYFTDVLMPDFDEDELDKAIEEFGKRQRRLGA